MGKRIVIVSIGLFAGKQYYIYVYIKVVAETLTQMNSMLGDGYTFFAFFRAY